MPTSVLLQPIDNADFIVPVEIEGTTHQVCMCVCARARVSLCVVCVHNPPLSRRRWVKLDLLVPSSVGHSLVQVIQDRLVPCRLGLLSITCFRKWPLAANEHTHTRSHGRTSGRRWQDAGMLMLMPVEVLKLCGVIYRCTS